MTATNACFKQSGWSHHVCAETRTLNRGDYKRVPLRFSCLIYITALIFPTSSSMSTKISSNSDKKLKIYQNTVVSTCFWTSSVRSLWRWVFNIRATCKTLWNATGQSCRWPFGKLHYSCSNMTKIPSIVNSKIRFFFFEKSITSLFICCYVVLMWYHTCNNQ